MADIQMAIEGEAAQDAAADLVAIDGLSVTVQPVDETHRDPTLLAIVATVVGISVGVATVADHIHKWYQKWKTPSPKSDDGDAGIERAVIVAPDGTRLRLENATVSEICQILDKLDNR